MPTLAQFNPLGHNDPAWSPDGKLVAFTYNQRSGAIGDPRIAIYTVATKKMRFLSAAGYARPSWSPDGKWIAAEKTDGKGRDVVLLNASTGAEVARLTNDGGSFAPTWSPDGTAVAFLHAQGAGIDLDLAVLGPGQSVRDGPDHRPHRVEPARRDLAAGLVHPGLGAAHARAHRATRERPSVERAVAQRAVTHGESARPTGRRGATRRSSRRASAAPGRSCAWASTRIRPASRAASPPMRRGRSDSPAWCSTQRCRTPRR